MPSPANLPNLNIGLTTEQEFSIALSKKQVSKVEREQLEQMVIDLASQCFMYQNAFKQILIAQQSLPQNQVSE